MLNSTAILLPPFSLPVNNQFFRLCRAQHKRKNWESLGSADAGPPAAVLFTILAGAKHHRLEPWAYLRDVLLRLSAGQTDLEPLLPDRCGTDQLEHVSQHRLDESRREAARQTRARQARRAMAGPKAWRPPVPTSGTARPSEPMSRYRVCGRSAAGAAGTTVRLRLCHTPAGWQRLD